MISPVYLKRFDEELNVPLQYLLENQLKEKSMAKEKEQVKSDIQILDNELITKELAPLDKTKAASIRKAFEPMVKMLGTMEIEAEEIFALDMSKETCGKARGLKIRIQKVRTAADNKRKEEKAQYILGGGAIQGFYNIFKAVVTPIEKKLEEIEKYYENLEKKKVTDLQGKRTLLLKEFEIDGSIMKLGEMQKDVWDNYFAGIKHNYESIKESAKKVTAAEKLKTDQHDIMQKRKVLLMPYGQFNPFIDLYPETTEVEFQEILSSMVIAKADFDKTQADLLIKQEEIKKENIALKKQVAVTAPSSTQTKAEFQKNALSGLLGKNYVPPLPFNHQVVAPIDETPAEKESTDKEILTGVAISVEARIIRVKSPEAKEALKLATNTLKIAAMML